MAVAVVVATRDRPERLAALIESLRAQTLAPSEIVVVDDGSASELPALEGVRVIRRGQSAGPAVARNEGWRAASADLVVFTDDDCVASAGWLAAVVGAAESRPGAIVQGRTTPMPDELDRLGPFSRTLRVDGGPYYQTCNIAYPRTVLESLGGFDESFPRPGGEDTDLAWRAIGAGVPVASCPDAVVHHAVERLGPAGMLRVAWRWSWSMGVFGKHPELRRVALDKRVFWKGSHYLLVRALLTLVLPRRLWGLAAWLWLPYAFHLVDRWRADGASPALAPWYVLHDLVELAAVARGAVRARTLVL